MKPCSNNTILFVYPIIGQQRILNHGICSLSAVLRKAGFTTQLLFIEHGNFADYIKQIVAIRPLFVAITSTFNHWEHMCRFADELKQAYDGAIFAGGPHTTLYPDALADTNAIDGVCIGEGERQIFALAKALKEGKRWHDIPGMWFRTTQGIKKNPLQALIENLDELPMPDYSLFPEDAIMNYPAFVFSRGCPFDCTYCCNKYLRKIFHGQGAFVRFKSVERCIEEIRSFLDRYPARIINFDDDTFIKSPQWRAQFLQEYTKKIRLSFNCNARAELLDEMLCAQLKEAGCVMLGIGVESGDEKLRTRVLGRSVSNATIHDAVEYAHRHGINISTFNMVGIPGETPEHHTETIELNRALNPDACQITVYYPYPGTELGDYCRRHGLVDGTYVNYFETSVLNLKEFSKHDIKRARALFAFRVFKDTQPYRAIESIIDPMVLSFVQSEYGEELPAAFFDLLTFVTDRDYERATNVLVSLEYSLYAAYPLIATLAEYLTPRVRPELLRRIYAFASQLEENGYFREAKKLFEAIRVSALTIMHSVGTGALFHMGTLSREEGALREAADFFVQVIQENKSHQKAYRYLQEIKSQLPKENASLIN